MDGLRLIGSSLLELDRRNAVQRFDLDAIIACDGVQLYLRKQGRFSARAHSIRLDGATLSATLGTRRARLSASRSTSSPPASLTRTSASSAYLRTTPTLAARRRCLCHAARSPRARCRLTC